MNIYDAYDSSVSGESGAFAINTVTVEEKVYGKSFLKISRILAVVGLLLLLVFYLPSAVYAVGKGYNAVAGRLFKDRSAGQAGPALIEKESPYIPEHDPSLPLENTLKIASVGIETTINEAMVENYEDALRLGVWRVDNFGDPDSQEMPTILTAHRYGYLKWTVDYRLKNSFYNLPKTDLGDVVEVNWMQRKYRYLIYGKSEGEEIIDYSADLILYTCRSLNGLTKVYRYAKLLRS